MSIEFVIHSPPFHGELIAELTALCTAVFDSPVADLQWRLQHMPDPVVCGALADGRWAGFKAGYAMSPSKYYSWLGGVHPEFRGLGIASTLMEKQHQRLRERGYTRVETSTNQENLAMHHLNLKHGLTVCGMRNEPHRVQIMFSRALA